MDDPYWCRVWPSALMLAAALTQHPELVRGRRVLELGCGLGLCGIAAAKAGELACCLCPDELQWQQGACLCRVHGLTAALGPPFSV